jgi:hypothetical protein
MIAAVALSAALASESATLSLADRRNIDLSMRIIARIGDKLWPAWSKTPFDIAVITANGAVLVNVDKPVPVPSVPPSIEATFPLSDGIPTIVIGEPQSTSANTPIRWSVILMHEHFHQWQDSWAEYQTDVKKLNLAPPNDQDGMWMLNYPFPYTRARVDAAYTMMAHALADALTSIGSSAFASRAHSYLVARAAFKQTLEAADYRYFAFQCWQEGVARYTEIAAARLASKEHAQDPSFLSDQESRDLADDATQTYDGVVKRLQTRSLYYDQRIDFYAVGAGEALLLDEIHPGWRQQYLDAHMDLAIFFGPGPIEVQRR